MRREHQGPPPRLQDSKGVLAWGGIKNKTAKLHKSYKALIGALLLLGALFLPFRLNAQTTHVKKGPVAISGWITFWDEGHKSIASFIKHADQIDRAYFELYKCGPDGLPARIKDATPELMAQVNAVARKNNVETWFTTGNYDVSISEHNKFWIQKFLYDGALRAKHIQMLVNFAKQDNLKGIQIDYENLLAGDKGAFTTFMNELDKAAKANGLMTGIALPAKFDSQGTWDDPQSRDYGAIGKATDQFVPMTYDYHWSTSPAGYITSPEWAEMCMKYAASVMEPGKIEVGYPAYGYDWVGTHGDTITWSKFLELVKKYKVKPIRDTTNSQELKINYTDEKGAKHEAWITDSVCLEYQANIVKRYKLYGMGVWYFGAEDESFWTVMKQVNSTQSETTFASKQVDSSILTADTVAPANVEFLTDNAAVDNSYAGPEGSKITIVQKQGKRWVDIVLKGTAWSFSGMGVARKNLDPLLKKGALQFYIRGAKGGENLDVGFVMEKGLAADEKIGFLNTVSLGGYCKVTTQWQLVTIPLADFPVNGYHFDENISQRVTGPFKFGRVSEFDVNLHAPGAEPVVEVLLSSIRVVPSFDSKAVERAKFKALQ